MQDEATAFWDISYIFLLAAPCLIQPSASNLIIPDLLSRWFKLQLGLCAEIPASVLFVRLYNNNVPNDYKLVVDNTLKYETCHQSRMTLYLEPEPTQSRFNYVCYCLLWWSSSFVFLLSKTNRSSIMRKTISSSLCSQHDYVLQSFSEENRYLYIFHLDMKKVYSA